MFSTRFKLTWDESVAQFAEELPWTLISFAIGVGSCLAIWIILYVSDCCFVSKSHNDMYIRKTRRCGKSAGRLFILFFAILVGTIGFWIACNTAGVSFWNILFAYGIATLIISVAFSAVLQNLGAYITIAMTNLITEDMYITFLLMPIEGRILEIGIVSVRMEYYDSTTQKYRQRVVQPIHFVTSAWERDTEKEEGKEVQVAPMVRVGLKSQYKLK
jgi:hypothetical protein